MLRPTLKKMRTTIRQIFNEFGFGISVQINCRIAVLQKGNSIPYY
jgi:hypothetical protein